MNKGYSKNMELVGFHDLHGIPAFQMAMYKTGEGRYYLYCGSFKGPYWNILDVTDPANPRSVKLMTVPNATEEELKCTNTPKIQIADGLMIAVTGGSMPMLHGNKGGEPFYASVMIFDIATDPENPRLLGEWRDGMAHRFCYTGGRYVHLSSTCKGYSRQIYRILDIIDPAHPVEVGRWWMPEQWIAGQIPAPVTDRFPVEARDPGFGYGGPHMDSAGLHGPPYVVGNTAYLSYGGAGVVILDISDITVPRLVGQLKLVPPFAGDLSGARTHTVLPLSGRPYCVATNEGERFACFNADIVGGMAQPMNNLHMVDIRNPARPTLIAEFPYPEVPEDFPYPNFNDCGIGAPGPFGPHNVHEPMEGKPWLENDPNRVYCCYFHAGMRVYDVSDPYRPREIAYFIPPNPAGPKFDVYMPGPLLGTAEDCVVDDRGYIFMATFHDGMYVLKCTAERR